MGRRSERGVLDRLIDAVRAGEGQALVVRGEPGVGKTALLDYVAGQASGLRVARAVGVQSEMELAFAGLHQLCAPMLDRLERLPGPQRDALRTAFGVSAGPAPDRFLVGLAVLSLLSEVAGEQPLVCLVDDQQWLDRASAQVLAFVARRLAAEPVGVVFAARIRGEELAGLPELVVGGLGEGDARALLESVLTGPLDARVRDRIVAETRGNPLALLELPRGRTPAELAGGFGFPGVVSLPGSIEEAFRRRVEALPAPSRRLLLLAAADPTGDPGLVWRAAGRLGIRAEAATPAAEAGLVEFGTWVRFRHPLVRSAAYHPASLQDRQDVHRALAEATDLQADPDRRAWHRAHAAPGPDEQVAGELERSAGRAQARGGMAAAAAFLERAAMLTPGPGRRAQRLLAAARSKRDAGALDAALGLLVAVEAGQLDPLQTAELERLRGQIALDQLHRSDAARLLLKAARQFEPIDARLARETYLEALSAALYAGRLASGGGVLEFAQAARAAPRAPQPPRAPDLLLDGLAVLITEGYAAGAPMLKQALSAFRGDELASEEGIHWLWFGCAVTPEPVAPELWDDEAWHELATQAVRLARSAGALFVLAVALSYRAVVHVHAGEFAAASALIEEANAISTATGNPRLRFAPPLLAAWRGQEAEALELIEASCQDAAARGEGRAIRFGEYVTAVLYNGLGRYETALAAAQRACTDEDVGVFAWALIELVEAGARSATPEVAAGALRRLKERTSVAGTDWALGIQARSCALLSDGQAAEALYREAIERLARSRIAVHLARAHLLYGEWLRREKRRLEAREQLRTAHEMFSHIGAAAFAERARRELLATGETARKRTAGTSGELTAQEAQIVRLARDGLSNPEIGARLFISPRTVQYHLRKVFIKLAISSRSQLDRVLPADPDLVPPR
ncbi:MAG TPA: AAA family ATPase [Streptosporangiaceae bacterium]|nr:AAA family ATPase [Streptosporangiaceae bacterium]